VGGIKEKRGLRVEGCTNLKANSTVKKHKRWGWDKQSQTQINTTILGQYK
jgi:hypothetical protein